MNSVKMENKIITIIGIILMAISIIVPSANALDIIIGEIAEVSEDTVYLSDIATFNPSADRRVPTLRKLVISASPSPGNKFKLDEKFLIYKIHPAIGKEDDIRAKIPKHLFVTRSAQYVAPDLLENIFKEHVLEKSTWPIEKITFERIITPGNISLPEGDLSWIIHERNNPNHIGNISISLELLVNNKKIRRVPLSGRISVTEKVIKAAHKINTGEIISKDNLVLISENNTRFQKGTITDLSEAIGKRSVRIIQEGQIVTTSMIENPPMIKKGNRVLIRAESPGLVISAKGKVLEDGCTGDQIRVVNISSGKEIVGIVSGPGLVKVVF